MRKFLCMLLPRFIAAWVWCLGIPLGKWAPHILGRAMGGTVTWRKELQ